MNKSEAFNNLDLLNDALVNSYQEAIKFHAEQDQPIIYRDKQDRLVEEYSDGRIVVVIDYNKTV